jgi:hypothetical protein
MAFNRLLRQHTNHPLKAALKSRFNHSYSDNDYLFIYEKFDSVSEQSAYCPACADEVRQSLGYTYWRRFLSEVKVCAKQNVKLLTKCQFCDKPFPERGMP